MNFNISRQVVCVTKKLVPVCSCLHRRLKDDSVLKKNGTGMYPSFFLRLVQRATHTTPQHEHQIQLTAEKLPFVLRRQPTATLFKQYDTAFALPSTVKSLFMANSNRSVFLFLVRWRSRCIKKNSQHQQAKQRKNSKTVFFKSKMSTIFNSNSLKMSFSMVLSLVV